uniref:Uncharacterized protein n=1 Tax=Medicago truncatula TaxID=3880 RepID=A2Q276_MEDTR|nr:hypothetical protein MtrDRAFT_AC149490g16v2 [Medicago truncatula]
MGDQWLNDRLIMYIERDVLRTIRNDETHFLQILLRI